MQRIKEKEAKRDRERERPREREEKREREIMMKNVSGQAQNPFVVRVLGVLPTFRNEGRDVEILKDHVVVATLSWSGSQSACATFLTNSVGIF